MKDRSYPIRLRMNRVLFSRLPENHPAMPDIISDYRKRRAGYKGELDTDYRLSFLNQRDYLLFRDLRLKVEQWFIQIDTLILTPRYILLIETKSHSGTLYFEKNSGQMIQTKNNQEIAFDNPLQQAKMHIFLLTKWLSRYQLKLPPMDFLIVVSNSSTVLRSNDPTLFRHVVKGDLLFDRVQELNKNFTKEIFSDKEVKKLSRLFVKNHAPQHPDILKAFSIEKKDILTGVQCPSCLHFGMERKNRTWICPFCQTHSKNAHYRPVYDFFLLHSPQMTNRDFREFLHLPSIKTASNLLSTMPLVYSGIKKGRIYHIPEDIEGFYSLVEKR